MLLIGRECIVLTWTEGNVSGFITTESKPVDCDVLVSLVGKQYRVCGGSSWALIWEVASREACISRYGRVGGLSRVTRRCGVRNGSLYGSGCSSICTGERRALMLTVFPASNVSIGRLTIWSRAAVFNVTPVCSAIRASSSTDRRVSLCWCSPLG